jgi:hypothetical protein
VNEYTDFAGYGDPADGPNATGSYATSANTADPSAIDNPDGLTDVGAVTGVNWATSSPLSNKSLRMKR